MDLGSRKENLIKQMKKDSYKRIQELEDVKRKANQKIDEIFSKFQINCLREWKDMNLLKSFADVRESSLIVDQKVTRMCHFFADLPLLMEEQIQVANQNEAKSTSGQKWGSHTSTGGPDVPYESSFVEMGDLLNLLEDPEVPPVTAIDDSAKEKKSNRNREKGEKSPVKSKKKVPERENNENLSGHAEQHSVESSSWVKPCPPIFIHETGENQPPLFRIRGECEFAARICYSESPKLFYLQIKSYTQSICSLTNEITNSMGAAWTGTQINSNHRRISRSSIPCVAIAFSSEWQNYFRAYVRSNLAGNRVEVYYMDWGNVEVIPLSYCFELLPQFEKHPAYAIACFLSSGEDEQNEEGFSSWNTDATPAEEDTSFIWPVSAGPFFQKHFSERTVQVKVLRSRNSQVSNDYDMFIYEVVVFLRDKNVFKELIRNRIIPRIETR